MISGRLFSLKVQHGDGKMKITLSEQTKLTYTTFSQLDLTLNTDSGNLSSSVLRSALELLLQSLPKD